MANLTDLFFACSSLGISNEKYINGNCKGKPSAKGPGTMKKRKIEEGHSCQQRHATHVVEFDCLLFTVMYCGVEGFLQDWTYRI